VVGLFNFEDRPEERTVDLGRWGLDRERQAVVFEFWEEKLLGLFKERLTLVLPPQTSRILFIRRSTGKPQVVGTDMHLLGGYHELPRLAWDEARQVLSLECRRAPGLPGRVFVHVPPGYVPHVDFPLNPASARLTNIGDGLWVQEVQFKDARRSLSIPFDKEAPK
jgi:hypothetical protein